MENSPRGLSAKRLVMEGSVGLDPESRTTEKGALVGFGFNGKG